ncbi:MAG TPA: hypothetical protein VHB47_21670, partial [Thermoanaerobaculia bacterium]|nr:hypothetical protein [Thermoanaerobaculia bacterium]
HLVAGRHPWPGAGAVHPGGGNAAASLRPPAHGSEDYGPNPTSQLEPPGFLALNYGRHTPVATILAHLLYGAILGAFYTLSAR